jgi:HlyD family secretion protein
VSEHQAFKPSKLPGFRAYWAWWAGAIVAIAALAWFFGGVLLLGPQVRTVPVIQADFVQTLVASGHIETPFRVVISSQIVGTVVKIPVSEGGSVKAGDLLIALDDREARATLEQAEGQVAQSNARLRQIRDLTLPAAQQSVAELRASLANAEKTLARIAKLSAGGFSSAQSRDDAVKIASMTRAQLRSAELKVMSHQPGGSDYVLAETQLAQALGTADAARTRLSYTQIRAPRDGILIGRNVETGSVIQPGAELMRLSPAGNAQIVVQIDEKNLGLVAIGQTALASADAYPKERFAASVAYINPAVDILRASVEVKLAVLVPPPYLRQDMTVSIDVEVARRPQALIAPSADVRGMNSSEPWLLIARNGQAIRSPVKIGLVSAGMAEILSGVAPGDRVIPAAAAEIPEGTRVRELP